MIHTTPRPDPNRIAPVAELAADPRSPRLARDEHLPHLARSLRDDGQHEPVHVVPREVFTRHFPEHAALLAAATWVVFVGIRRLAAAHLVTLETLHIYVHDDLPGPYRPTGEQADEPDPTPRALPLHEIAFNPASPQEIDATPLGELALAGLRLSHGPEVVIATAAGYLHIPVVVVPRGAFLASLPKYAGHVGQAKWVVILGNHRVIAARRAGFDTIGALVLGDSTDASGNPVTTPTDRES